MPCLRLLLPVLSVQFLLHCFCFERFPLARKGTTCKNKPTSLINTDPHGVLRMKPVSLDVCAGDCQCVDKPQRTICLEAGCHSGLLELVNIALGIQHIHLGLPASMKKTVLSQQMEVHKGRGISCTFRQAQHGKLILLGAIAGAHQSCVKQCR